MRNAYIRDIYCISTYTEIDSCFGDICIELADIKNICIRITGAKGAQDASGINTFKNFGIRL